MSIDDIIKAYDELIDVTVSAFDSPELEMVVKRKTGMTLYDKIERGPFDQEVYRLLEFMKKNGNINDLLRGMAEAKPRRSDLRRVILRYAPQAFESPAPPAVQAQAVVAGVRTLRSEADENPAVRGVLVASRDKLDQLNGKIDELFHYKELHDCLHTIQLRHYPTLVDRIKHFCSDPLASMELRNKILELSDICTCARDAAEKLPENKSGKERLWVAKLEAAVDELSSAVDNIEEHSAAHAVRQIRRRIQDEPARINGHLTDAAEELPLNELAETIKTVISAFPAGDGSNDALHMAVRSLQETQPRLRGRVAEHREWQDVEKDFWWADDCIERGLIEEFKEVWSDIEAQLDSLTRTEPEAPWAKALRDESARIDNDLSDQVNLAVSEYKSLRHAALYHFVKLDEALLSQCKAILAIRDPLQHLSTLTYAG